jgi:integrase
MASVTRENRNGRTMYRVWFYDRDGNRRSIRLGDVKRKAADTIATKIEHLVSASVAGNALDPATAQWVADLGQELSDKLADAGLIGHRESATLAAFLDAYIASRGDAKPNTIRNLKNTRGRLVQHFGAERPLHTIKPGEADEWRQAMVNAGLADATISKAVKHAKQFFRLAQRKGLVRSNPFAELTAGGERNDARLHFIDRATVDKLLDTAPDAEWRLIIALARFGGLRTPSETLALRWSEVDWVAGKITVPSPKTERQGKANRVVPLFPELRKHLEAAFDPEKVYCVNRYRDSNANLRTQLLRIIRRAGLNRWERLFHNLRASRQTELTDEFPAHVVADWLGNTPEVADRHYLQTTEAHFRRAVVGSDSSTAAGVVQGVVQTTAEASGINWQPPMTDDKKSPEIPSLPAPCELVQTCTLPPRGVEPRFSG